MTTFVTTPKDEIVATKRGVPWWTVIPLAVVLSYGDGFWLTSLRVTVGSIETTQTPFESWVRNSTLAVPVYVLAVLGALALALHWLGPVVRRPRSVLATMLLVVVAGTVAGTVILAASSAYDYHLQSAHLTEMGSMGGACVGACLEQSRHNTFILQVRAVLYGSGILLVTNVILVTWVVALRGGRVDVTAPQRQTARPPHRSASRSRLDDLVLLLAFGLVASGVIHAAVVPEHLAEWGAAGMFFIALTAAELAVAALLFVRPGRAVWMAAAVVSAGPLLLWLVSRTFGMPFGPEAGVPEAIGLADCAACLLELGTLVAAVVLLRSHGWLRRPALSAHASRLALVAVVAVGAIGLAGTSLTWFNTLGTSGDSMSAHE